MNLVTSTLVLVHADKEEVFWTLSAILERFFLKIFSLSLLPSRACPLVLLDYFPELIPKLHAHLTDLGVDLVIICFCGSCLCSLIVCLLRYALLLISLALLMLSYFTRHFSELGTCF